MKKTQFIKGILKRLIYRHRASSEAYVAWLRKKGCSIGEGTRFFDPLGTEIDVTRPPLIQIGNNVMITQNVIILTHGFDWFVLNGVYGDVLGSSGRVRIGDNVFIGSHSVILKGVTIGDNCIIGAGSVVNKNIPNNTVVAGNPAKILCSLSEYYEKRVNAQLDEAFGLYKAYRERGGGIPPKSIFSEFFWLFENSEDGVFSEASFNYEMNIGNRFEKTFNRYRNTKRLFSSYEEFCTHCESKLSDMQN